MDDLLFDIPETEPLTEHERSIAKEVGERYVEDQVQVLSLAMKCIQNMNLTDFRRMTFGLSRVMEDLKTLERWPAEVLDNPNSALCRVIRGKPPVTHKDLMEYMKSLEETSSNPFDL